MLMLAFEGVGSDAYPFACPDIYVKGLEQAGSVFFR